MKLCKKCNEEKSLDKFHIEKRNGKPRSYCKICTNQMNNKYYHKNKDILLSKQKIYRENNIDMLRKRDRLRRLKNGDYIRKKDREYWSLHKNKKKEKDLRYRKSKKGKLTRLYHCALRRANKLNATPSWANKDKIKIVYEKAKWLETITGLKYHVDHIIPLNGKNVCGLHVWENLQILEANLNLKKGNY